MDYFGFLLIGAFVVGMGKGGLASAAGVVLPGLFWGMLTGIASFVTHSGGPPAQAFLFPQRLPRLELAGTMTIAFAIINLAKLPGYAVLGLFEGLDPTLVLPLAGAGIAGTVAGRWVVQRLHDATYIRVIEVLLFALSVLLIGKALASWIGA